MMVNKVIEKEIDIYGYPDEFFGHSGSITMGDLHGNAVKFAHFLLRHDVIKFKDEVSDPARAYQQFVERYEESGKITQIYIENSRALRLQQGLIKVHQKTIARYDELAALDVRDQEQEAEFTAIDRDATARYLQAVTAKANEHEQRLQEARVRLPTMVDQFNHFISQIEMKDGTALIRLIGDELADRGSNDYFTLRLLDFLHENKVDIHIIISNHSNEFITAYENLLNHNVFDPKNDITDRQKQSFLGLKFMLEEKVISQDEVTRIVNESYKPTLKIIDYTLSEDGITLFSHAPVRFDLLRPIANSLGVVYKDATKEDLAATIDKVNTQFAVVVKENKVHELCDTAGLANIDHMTPAEITALPLVNLIWNRWNAAQDTEDARPASVNRYCVHYVHGHDPYKSKFPQVINLDTSSGKESREKQQETITRAKEELANPSLSPEDKQQAQNYLDGLKEKILDSNECGLNQKHSPQLIDKEYQQLQQQPHRVIRITAIFSFIVLALGAALGVGLVATGIFAPFGVSILWAVALAVPMGGWLATIAEALVFVVATAIGPPTINTLVVPNDRQASESRLNVKLSEADGSLRKLKVLGGKISPSVEEKEVIHADVVRSEDLSSLSMNEEHHHGEDIAQESATLKP